jgi:DNA-directed RNA polymerase subunit delta
MAILTVETKEEKSLFEILVAQAKGKAAKKKDEDEDDDDDVPVKGKSSGDDDDDIDEEDDDWNKDDEEDAWDPDFEEFDLPKSKGKSAAPGAGTKKGAVDEEEDFKVDDEFKDLFNDSGSLDDDDDDF